MPPKTAMRVASAIVRPARGVGAEGPVLVAGIARLMPQGEWPQRPRQRVSQAGVGGIDQDGTDEDAAIGDDPTVTADQRGHVVILQHLGRDALLVVIAT